LKALERSKRTIANEEESSTAEDVRKELVFVDGSIADYDALVSELRGDRSRDLAVVVLDPAGDGLEQISRTLALYSDLDAVHIVSHGEEGEKAEADA
jgi:hypothetical protein